MPPVTAFSYAQSNALVIACSLSANARSLFLLIDTAIIKLRTYHLWPKYIHHYTEYISTVTMINEYMKFFRFVQSFSSMILRRIGDRMTELKILVGKRLRQMRSEKGLTQAALAERADMIDTYLAGIERGERNIALETLQK